MRIKLYLLVSARPAIEARLAGAKTWEALKLGRPKLPA